MLKVIGITGGIGSGKSTVCHVLSEKLKAPILDADKISKQAMNSPEIILLIKKFFGEVIFESPELIDRAKLADIVFSNEKKLSELNNIIHPYVMKEIEKKINELKECNEFILLDVPLPNEDFIRLSNKIIVVVTNEETRIKRVMKRSGLSESDVKRRIAKQMNTENYIKLADFIIKNNGNIDELNEKINTICETLNNI